MEAQVDRVCNLLDWDTQFFGFRVARAVISPQNDEDMERIIKWCYEHKIRCLYLLIALEDREGLYVAQEHRCLVTDIRLTLERTPAPHSQAHLKQIPVRSVIPSDVEYLKGIAQSSYQSTRFYFDPHFPRPLVDQLYVVWTEQYCLTTPHQVLVAILGDKPAGYITYSSAANGAIQIDLIAVDASARGSGVGKALMDAAIRRFEAASVPKISVVTQGRNIAAQRLYYEFGFVPCRAEAWLHCWFAHR